MTRIPRSNRVLNAGDRNSILNETQRLIEGCMIGDIFAVKVSREVFHKMIEAATPHELHDFWIAITSLADRHLGDADRKEGLR